MPVEISSGFFFDTQKWRGSRSVQRMSFAERGVYFEMLIEQWEKRNLPDSAVAVAELIASSDAQAQEVVAAWDTVRRKFLTASDDRHIYNMPLERTRRKQAANRRRRQEAGQRGGNAAAAKRLNHRQLHASNAIAGDGAAVANPSDLTRQDKTGPEETGLEKTGTRNGNGLRERFAEFWKHYPRKAGKDAAWRAWQKRRPSDELLKTMLAVLEWQRKTEDWVREGGQFIPHPSTWLNQGRWEDEPSEVPQGLGKQTTRLMTAIGNITKDSE